MCISPIERSKVKNNGDYAVLWTRTALDVCCYDIVMMLGFRLSGGKEVSHFLGGGILKKVKNV